MDKKKIARKIQKILNNLYPTPQIPLTALNNYTFLIAVVLSAQSTDRRVNEVTPTLFQKASTPQEMIELGKERVREIIRPCGLSLRKAQFIIEISKILLEKYGGEVPESFEALEKLPGVGPKTAAVVMSQAFKHNAFPVDTHIHRCAKRWGLSSGKNVKKTAEDLKLLFPKKDWNRLHLQIIYFAREYCSARGHRSLICPICSWIPKAISD